MLQYSYTPTGRLVIVADTADILVQAMFNQYDNGLRYVPQTFIPKSSYVATYQLQMDVEANVPTVENPVVNIYTVSSTTRKILARDSESYFAICLTQYKEGYGYVQGSSTISTAAYVITVTKAEGSTVKTESLAAENTKVDTFDLSVALALETKDELLDYCAKYNVEIPSTKKTLASIRNYLKSQSIG